MQIFTDRPCGYFTFCLSVLWTFTAWILPASLVSVFSVKKKVDGLHRCLGASAHKIVCRLGVCTYACKHTHACKVVYPV